MGGGQGYFRDSQRSCNQILEFLRMQSTSPSNVSRFLKNLFAFQLATKVRFTSKHCCGIIVVYIYIYIYIYIYVIVMREKVEL